MTPSQYRTLLLASIAVGIIGATADFVFPELVPDGFRDIQVAQDAAISTPRALLASAFGVPGALLYFASIYGLFRFRPWAPRLSILGTMLLLMCLPFAGALAQSGVAISMSYLASYLWGATVVLANVQPTSSLFKRRDG